MFNGLIRLYQAALNGLTNINPIRDFAKAKILVNHEEHEVHEG